MHGVVSLLNEEHYAMVEDLWAELETAFGVRSLYKTPFPHFSYHVASQYDLDLLEPVLRQAASESPKFNVRATGLGIFTGPQPVLYVPVVRNGALTEFHRALWHSVEKASGGSVNYYHPDLWVPHITLGDGETAKEHLPEIVRYLSGRELTWEIEVNNLALIYDAGASQEVRLRLPCQAIG